MINIEYQNSVKELAFSIMYNVACADLATFSQSYLTSDIEVAVDTISSLFKIPKNQVDIDVSLEMEKINMDEIIKLKTERMNSTLQ